MSWNEEWRDALDDMTEMERAHRTNWTTLGNPEDAREEMNQWH